MQHRRYSFFPSALAAALLAAAGACSKVPGTEPGKTHTVALDARDKVVAIDANVAVGSRVRFTEQTGDDKARRITARA